MMMNVAIIQDIVKSVSVRSLGLVTEAEACIFCVILPANDSFNRQSLPPTWLHMTPRSHFKDNNTQVHGRKETMILSLAWLNFLL